MRVFETRGVDREGAVDNQLDGVFFVAFEGIIDDAISHLKCHILRVTGVVALDVLVQLQQIGGPIQEVNDDVDLATLPDDLRLDVFSPHCTEELDSNHEVCDASIVIGTGPTVMGSFCIRSRWH